MELSGKIRLSCWHPNKLQQPNFHKSFNEKSWKFSKVKTNAENITQIWISTHLLIFITRPQIMTNVKLRENKFQWTSYSY